MTKEEMLDTLESATGHLFDAVGGDPNVPLCEVLEAELHPDEHANIHGLFMGITSIGTEAGFSMASQYVAFAFCVGRKWGMTEAAQMLSSDIPDAPDAPQ